jgi:hypothetical protein
MADNQKYFLDLSGLTTLWNKIKATFADKDKTEKDIAAINTNVGTLSTRLDGVDNDVTSLETTVLTIAPREVDYYSQAVETSKTLAVGTIINVKTDKTSAEDETPSGFSAGLYVVTGKGQIEYISTSDGDADGSSLTALAEKVQELDGEVVKSATIVDATGKQLGTNYDVSNNVLLVAHDDGFELNSDSVRALTHRAVAAKFRELENTISGIPKFKILVVDELPTAEISTSTIYLVRNKTNVTDKNLFTEYIYIDNGGKGGSWEKLGEQTLDVGDIVTNSQLNNAISTALASYAKKTDVDTAIATAKNELKTDILSVVEETYATKEDVENISKDLEDVTTSLDSYLTKNEASTTYLSKDDAAKDYLSKNEATNKGWMTEAEIITSIQLGEIGKAIAITSEQIDDVTKEN